MSSRYRKLTQILLPITIIFTIGQSGRKLSSIIIHTHYFYMIRQKPTFNLKRSSLNANEKLNLNIPKDATNNSLKVSYATGASLGVDSSLSPAIPAASGVKSNGMMGKWT